MIIMSIIIVIISSILTHLIFCDISSRPVNLKCADVYCINLDEYSKLDIPTNLVEVWKKGLDFFFLIANINFTCKVQVDLDVLQILEVDDLKSTISFSMYFGVR